MYLNSTIKVNIKNSYYEEFMIRLNIAYSKFSMFEFIQKLSG